jgi:hypothetical protein
MKFKILEKSRQRSRHSAATPVRFMVRYLGYDLRLGREIDGIGESRTSGDPISGN